MKVLDAIYCHVEWSSSYLNCVKRAGHAGKHITAHGTEWETGAINEEWAQKLYEYFRIKEARCTGS
jgi:hypothetical protein